MDRSISPASFIKKVMDYFSIKQKREDDHSDHLPIDFPLRIPLSHTEGGLGTN